MTSARVIDFEWRVIEAIKQKVARHVDIPAVRAEIIGGLEELKSGLATLAAENQQLREDVARLQNLREFGGTGLEMQDYFV